jgi:hypothetical protein
VAQLQSTRWSYGSWRANKSSLRPGGVVVAVTQHQKALKFAQDHLGEHELPSGSNTGPFVLLCQRATWLAGTKWPWCVAFVHLAWKESGQTLPWRTAGSFDLLKRARKAGWAVSIEKAIPGDACVWNIGAGHCSMLESFDARAKMVHTIDGNWGDKVARVAHPVSQLRGCVHIHESADARPAKPAKPPMFEVVTSASGTSKVIWSGTRKGLTGALARLLAKFPGGITIRRGKEHP